VTINSGDAGSTSLASGGCRFNSLSKILVVEKTMNRTLLSVLLLMLCFASLALTASNGKVHAQALPTPLRGYTTYIPVPWGPWGRDGRNGRVWPKWNHPAG
jgi:hypothetical protein